MRKLIEASIDDDDVAEARRQTHPVFERVRGVCPVPRNVLVFETLLEPLAIPDLAYLVFGQQHPEAAARHIIVHAARHDLDVDAGEMPLHGTRKIERALQTRFLPDIIMHQEQDVLHGRSSDWSAPTLSLGGCARYEGNCVFRSPPFSPSNGRKSRQDVPSTMDPTAAFRETFHNGSGMDRAKSGSRKSQQGDCR